VSGEHAHHGALRRAAFSRAPGSAGSRRAAFTWAPRHLPAKELAVLLIIAVLLLALILFGVGFAVHVLWWIALIVLALWLLGFLFRRAEGGGSRRRWYRW
jgi:lysylphosphatidylglycerol synthetase-like protein (DUF2156 family)